jgi:uncharacterized membrane protein YhaH (DUF805 family)
MVTDLFSFRGRVGRFRYISTDILTYLAWIIFLVFILFLEDSERYSTLNMLYLAMFLTGWIKVAAAVKRCHDLNLNGWWCAIPLWSFAVLTFVKGTHGENKYGEPVE